MKADHAGMCYLCATPIYVGDNIQCWSVNTTPVAAHIDCVEENMAGGQSIPSSQVKEEEKA